MKRSKIDPERVADLTDTEYEILANGLERIHVAKNEADIPGDLLAVTFRLLRKVGAKVSSFYDMKIAALVFAHRRALIENLRRFQ